MYRKLIAASVGLAMMGMAGAADATIITFSNETIFQSQLGADLTLVNLDASPLVDFTAPFRVEDVAPAAAFLTLGIDFINVNAEVVDGNAFQLSKAGRDRIIFNGAGWDGDIAINLVNPVNGIGAWSNDIDGGRVRAFSGLGLGGALIGEAGFGGFSNFGGLTSTDLIHSVEFTCDFNADLKCGVFDIQFGTFAVAESPALPEPPTLAVFAIGLVGLAFLRRRRGRRMLIS